MITQMFRLKIKKLHFREPIVILNAYLKISMCGYWLVISKYYNSHFQEEINKVPHFRPHPLVDNVVNIHPRKKYIWRKRCRILF